MYVKDQMQCGEFGFSCARRRHGSTLSHLSEPLWTKEVRNDEDYHEDYHPQRKRLRVYLVNPESKTEIPVKRR